MRYRKLSDSGDYVFGQGPMEFYIDTPEAVGQAVKTRLGLMQGEWFLDETAGTPYSTQILGAGTQSTYDQAFQEVILNTQGVLEIQEYASALDSNRRLTVSALISTIYGQTTIQQVF